MDLRIKLSQEEKLEIKKRYDAGERNRTALAMEYGVCKSTINNIVNPDILEKERARKKGSWKKYYTTEKARKWMRDYRARRKSISCVPSP